MDDLDFAALYRIEAALAATPLDDLVAVLGGAEDGRLLLVYNSVALPLPLACPCEAILLDDLWEVDVAAYGGLFAGISALDVIRDDLVTKGPTFYPLEQMLVHLGGRDVLHRTSRNLAYYLVDLLKTLSALDPLRRQRLVIKVLQLALPALLDERGAEDLVAVRPGPDLGAFVSGQGGVWLTVGDDLASFPRAGEDGWIVALEEMSVFDPRIDPHSGRFVDLRCVLRRAGYDSALQRTCRALAEYCARQAGHQPSLWPLAWALMVESWLAGEDVQDLVAFFPAADFWDLAATGEGLRVYRTLDERARDLAPGPRWALADLRVSGVPDEYREPGFALVSLNSIVGPRRGKTDGAILGGLLFRAGQALALAQTLSLLARDGLNDCAGACSLPPALLSDLARRGVMLTSLGNPWAWRQGRYRQSLAAAYRTLRHALRRQGRAASGTAVDYYRALVHWYDCFGVEGAEVNARLHEMATDLRALQRGARREENDPYLADARQLLEVEETALYPLATAGSEEQAQPTLDARVLPSDLGRVLALLARQPDQAGCLSPVFERAWRQLRRLRTEHHQVQTREHNVDVQQRKLRELLAHARQQRHLVFAPPHEMAVLHAVYDGEIAGLERHVHELETEARLEITPLNPRLDFQREVDLVFEVRNAGRVDAHGVELVLARDPTFELLDRSSIREFPILRPGVPQRFAYRVRAVHQPNASLPFTYTYRGLEERPRVAVRLPVRSLDDLPFEMKGDPYQFGRAIQKPADFYGREDDVKKILSSLYRGGHTNFLLRGPRRMGKTSMLYMLQHALAEAAIRRRFDIPEHWDDVLTRYRPVMLDLQGFTFEDDQAHIARFFRRLLEATCAAIAPALGEQLLAGFDRRWREVDVPRAVLEQLDVAFDRQPGARVVVLLDEYDELYHPQGRSLDTALRHVVQSEQRLTWIIASTEFLFKESKQHGSPWFNILHIVGLDCLSAPAAQRLVEEPSRDERVAWQSDAIVTLLDETGYHPAFLQLFCSKIMSYLNRERQNYVLPRTIAILADEIVQERQTIHSHFEFYWADTPGVGRLILLAADGSDRPLSRLAIRRWVQARLAEAFGARVERRVRDARGDLIPWWDRQFEDGMSWVADVVRALRWDETSRTYSFAVPLFHRWLRHRGRYEDLLEATLAKVETEMEQDERT